MSAFLLVPTIGRASCRRARREPGVLELVQIRRGEHARIGDDHDGIIELASDAPVGAVYADWAGLNDPVIDVAITPNKQDCMGVRGIARDLAAAGLGTLKDEAIATIPATAGASRSGSG